MENRNLMEDVSDGQNRYERTYIKNFYTRNRFKFDLFVIGKFLQHTAHTTILYLGNAYIGANGVRHDFICKQKGKWSVLT